MGSSSQNFPYASVLIGSICIFLFFLEIILVATVFPGMPAQFWLIGIAFLIIGIFILFRAYMNYGSSVSETYKLPSSEQTISTISDEEMKKSFRNNAILAIVCWIVAAISAPWALADISAGGFTMSMATFSAGLGLGLVCTFFAFLNKAYPEKHRSFLEEKKRRKKK